MPAEELPAADLSTSETYRLMTDLVAPRPIAWVSTVDGDGRSNLAPFSYFQAVCSRPPTIIIGIGWHADGRMKDTLRNILSTGELVVNHVSEPLLTAMHQSSADYPPEVSEWEAVGIAGAPAALVRPARVRDAKAALECRLRRAIPIGEGPAGAPSSTLVIAEVLHFAVAQELLRRDGRGRLAPIDPGDLGAIGRLGGIAYTRTDSRVEIPRPRLATRTKEEPRP